MKLAAIINIFLILGLFSCSKGDLRNQTASNGLNKMKFKVLKSIKPDIDNDGIKDYAAVYENPVNKKRMLFIALLKKNGKYKKYFINKNAIYKADEGGAMGDPFQGISYKNGLLQISFYGGSSWRWSSTYKFKFKDNAFYLVMLETSSFHASSLEGTWKVYDYEKGVLSITKKDARRNKIKRVEKLNVKPVNLKDFNISEKQNAGGK